MTTIPQPTTDAPYDRAGNDQHPMNDTTSVVSYELVLEAGRADKHYRADLWLYCEMFKVLA